jgi:hypothetical protein
MAFLSNLLMCGTEGFGSSPCFEGGIHLKAYAGAGRRACSWMGVLIFDPGS